MFWRFGGYSNISAIDTLLDKPDVTLEELLNEGDLIQELKSHNTKLIEFVREETTLSRLLNYVVAPGKPIDDRSEDEEESAASDKGKGRPSPIDTGAKQREEDEAAEKLRIKYAYVACEVLSSETWSIIEALMSNLPHLTEFWDFLRRPAPLDPLQAGYFTKVNETLLEKKTEDMLAFFKSLPDVIPAILQHVDCPMVMDLLLKIISLEKVEGGQGIVDWLQSQNLIPILLSYLEPDCNSSTQTSAGDFLKAIITISANAAQNEQSCIGPNSLTRQVVSEPCMKSLISSMLQGGNPLTVGVGIVIEVIRKNNSDYDPENGHNPDAAPTSSDPIYLGTLLRMFAQHVPDFMDLILSSKHTVTDGEKTTIVERGHLSSAWGTKIEPLGFDRFKTCELMAELLHCSNMGLLNERGSEELIKERDAERERLKARDEIMSQREAEDSAVDISMESSRFENAPTISTVGSTDDLQIANSSEEDGFETVAIPGASTAQSQASDSTDDLFAKICEPSASGTASVDSADQPRSPVKTSATGQSSLQTELASALSPTTAVIDDKVHNLSVEDTIMTSPPSESADEGPGATAGELRADDDSQYTKDKPAPLFAKAKDPNKTPTAASPEPPRSPRSPKTHGGNASISSQMEMQLSDESQEMMQSDDEPPVVGDYLKIMFVEHQVVPTILSFFFRFPWNNFLHNVVYDVVQQVFNGPMDRGHNRFVAYDLFETGRITDQIMEGQRRSDEAQRTKNMRLGYMGHLTLVAEEVVKFGERHPGDILSDTAREKIYGGEWQQYVDNVLAETRERDNAILGGVRPETGMGPRQAVLNAVNAGPGFGGSNALANAGLNGGTGMPMDSVDLSNNGSATSNSFGSGSSLTSGFAGSSDDEDDEMDDADDEEQGRLSVQMLSDTAAENSDHSIPLLPPPPAPLNIAPSRARRRLADRLALQRQRQEEEEAAASEFGAEDDPFASRGDNDYQDNTDHFSLDEEEQDITSFGHHNADPYTEMSSDHDFSVSRGITGLFAAGSGRHRHEHPDDFDASLEDTSSGSSNSDVDLEHPPLEARTSRERQPLEIDDDDDDDEMGEMVTPSEENNSSDDEEVISPLEKERLRGSFGAAMEEPVSEFDGQQDIDDDDDDDEGEGLVEIALPPARIGSRS